MANTIKSFRIPVGVSEALGFVSRLRNESASKLILRGLENILKKDENLTKLIRDSVSLETLKANLAKSLELSEDDGYIEVIVGEINDKAYAEIRKYFLGTSSICKYDS